MPKRANPVWARILPVMQHLCDHTDMPNAAQTSKRSSVKPAAKKPAAGSVVAKKRAAAKHVVAKKATNVKAKKGAGVVEAVHAVSRKAKTQSVSDVVNELAKSYGFEHSRPKKKAAPNPYDMSAKKASEVLRGAGVVTKSGKLSSIYK